MLMYGDQKGLVYTNENCIGCNKCISVCPVITANRAVKTDDGEQRIEVDAAIYAKKHLNITDKLAFISPCIAKRDEINDPKNKGYVSYNVTFDHLAKYARQHKIKAEPAENEIEYGLGSIYPMPGGLKENVYWFCDEEVFIRQIEGEKHASKTNLLSLYHDYRAGNCRTS